MKRISDIIVNELISLGFKQVFMITGGGAMHLNDAFSRRKNDLNITFNHHEQASAIAAESYCRLCGEPAILNVTTGPGGINALNGVHGAYVDSIAMVIISGQIKRDTMAKNYPIPLRQLGDQEVDIISMVKSITKFAIELQDPSKTLEIIDKAVYIAKNGRPGPVWIDVPMDIQSALIDETQLRPWSCNEQALLELRGDFGLSPNTLGDFSCDSPRILREKAEVIINHLKRAQRPVLMGGTGIHIAKCEDAFLTFAEKTQIPAVGGWNAYDLVPTMHECYAGRPGTVGDRAGNFTVQNADFLLILGCRLNIRQISYNWNAFAEGAWKAHIDIDPAELHKPTLNNNISVHADLKIFMPILQEELKKWAQKTEHKNYLNYCRSLVQQYPVLLPLHKHSAKVNHYYFMNALFNELSEGDVVVAANATAAVASAQAGMMKKGVRMYSNSGSASMGYDLPAAIGAAMTGRAKRIICLAGDGSIMMNLQELQTISTMDVPIIIFLLNNDGYLSIRLTQSAYFPDNKIGTGPSNGVIFPDFVKIANAFGIKHDKIMNHKHLTEKIKEALSNTKPAFYEILLDAEQGFEPKLASRALEDGTMLTPALDDMAPFLPQEELDRIRGHKV